MTARSIVVYPEGKEILRRKCILVKRIRPSP